MRSPWAGKVGSDSQGLLSQHGENGRLPIKNPPLLAG